MSTKFVRQVWFLLFLTAYSFASPGSLTINEISLRMTATEVRQKLGKPDAVRPNRKWGLEDWEYKNQPSIRFREFRGTAVVIGISGRVLGQSGCDLFRVGDDFGVASAACSKLGGLRKAYEFDPTGELTYYSLKNAPNESVLLIFQNNKLRSIAMDDVEWSSFPGLTP